MKKIFLLLALVLVLAIRSFAKDVDSATALTVAKNFYLQNVPAANSQALYLSLAYEYKTTRDNGNGQNVTENLIYIFNINDDGGFVIVSGDDIVIPITGYSDKGKYDVNNVSPEFQKWMEGYKSQILLAKENQLAATPEIEKQWSYLITGKNLNINPHRGSVSPLLTTTWDQGNVHGFYNSQCPTDKSLPDAINKTHQCVTGCVATAMAQIMKFWNYPATGTGFHSYYSSYGSLSANFGSTNYNWSSMPNNVTAANADVAALMYQCGVSVNMNYSPDESGAFVITADNPTCAQYAYPTYFGYNSSTIQGLKRDNYNDVDWINLLKNELNNSRPIQYVGSGTGGGHTWVCDGYDANDLLHMNWGWGGIDNGYFDLDALNPGTLGAGGGTGGFNSNEQALIGIEPGAGGGGTGTNTGIILNSAITITPNPISFEQAFTINYDIYNGSVNTFNGTFCAALFTTSGTFINYIDSAATGSQPLPSGYHYVGGLTFTISGMLTVPGNYIVGVYYKPTGGNWYLAGSTTYTNPVNLTIIGPKNNLELNSDITANPLTLVKGKAATINANFLNKNSFAFKGTYDVAIYDLNGTFVEDLGRYTETAGLPANNGTYTSPYITFNTASVTANPGPYILAIFEQQKDSTNWYLVGGDNFTNPININVVAPNILPDIYEPDNTEPTAYNLPVTWSGNTANPKTTGSTIHIGSDYDYYKISLDAGYKYTITARVDDSYSSVNGTTYSCDVVWSYNTGTSWSFSYDDVMPGNIIVNDAGTVTFFVAPYFAGLTGTYLLDIHITRGSLSGIDNIWDNNMVKLYPNPADNFIHLDLTGKNITNEQIRIFNSVGQLMFDRKLDVTTIQSIDISNFANGAYYLEALDSKQKYFAKFVVGR